MGKVNPKELGTGKPKVEQTDFEGDYTIATIVSVGRDTIDDESRQGGKRPVMYLQFKEFGDKVVFLNVTQANSMVTQLGDDDDSWVNQQVPLEKYTGSFGSKKFAKVGVMAAEEWDEAFREAGVKRTKGATRAPASAPAGRARR